jgi:hypothetical protein
MQDLETGAEVSPEVFIAKGHIADRTWDIEMAKEKLAFAWIKAGGGTLGALLFTFTAATALYDGTNSENGKPQYLFATTQALMAGAAGELVRRAWRQRKTAKIELKAAKLALSEAEYEFEATHAESHGSEFTCK